jgi:hypothetical protein
VLTDTGRMVYRYAEDIFSLGRELQDALRDRPRGQALRFAVGVADSLPKALVHRLLAPAFEAGDDVRVTFIDGEPERLLAQLALHELDLVVSDFPASPRLGLKAFTHVLGECGVTFFAAPSAVKVDVVRMYGVRVVGRVAAIRERLYAISVEKRLVHPAVVAISRAARTKLFRGRPRND